LLLECDSLCGFLYKREENQKLLFLFPLANGPVDGIITTIPPARRIATSSGPLPMTHRVLPAALALLVLAPTTRAVDPSDLKPGLVAFYLEPHKGPPPPGVSRVEPTVALTLNSGEAPHPRLKGLMSAKWSGYINIVRPGKYTFAANVRGGVLTVRVGEKEAITVTSGDKDATSKTGAELTLEGGVLPFEATFASPGGVVRVELLWEGRGSAASRFRTSSSAISQPNGPPPSPKTFNSNLAASSLRNWPVSAAINPLLAMRWGKDSSTARPRI
jgi:hypothetical protein